VDKETGWICHLSYTHKVAVAFEGQEKVPTPALYREYRGKRALTPSQRKLRLKPLNDLFSMAECCLIADTVQFFKSSGIPYCPKNAVTDILGAISATHISGDFHRLVAEQPQRYFRPMPHLRHVLDNFKQAGKRLIFVSNSPFWYVNAGMTNVIGPNWRESWDAVITSAGKPEFYTQESRPFREVNTETGRIKFNRVSDLFRFFFPALPGSVLVPVSLSST
jgi:HAD superfamily 5'-nucleotidase-like hydrolase